MSIISTKQIIFNFDEKNLNLIQEI